MHNFGDIGDDGVGIVVGNLGQEMLLDGGVNGEFHFLGVDHHELQFRRVLFVKQRSDDGIQTNRFTLTGGTGYKEVGRLVRSTMNTSLVMVLPSAMGNSKVDSWNFLVLIILSIDTMRGFLLGTSIPMVPLPGMGAMQDARAESERAYVVLEVADAVDAHTGCR